MAKVITEDGLVDEAALTWKVWREDAGASWTVVHELRNSDDLVVRRDSWVIFKTNANSGAGALLGAI